MVRSDFEVPFSDPDYFNELHHDPPEIVDRVAWSTFPYLPSHFLPAWPWVAEGGWGAQEPDSSFPMAMQRRPANRDTNNNHSDFTLGGLNPQNQGDVNTAPVAADDSYTTARGSFQLTVAAPGVLANDSDAEGDSLSAALVDDVAHGSLTLNADGSFTYTPNADCNGTDSFTYVAGDGEVVSAPTTVRITIPSMGSADHVVISEVFTQGGRIEEYYDNVDYVELYNPTSETVDLGGWTLQFSGGGSGWQLLAAFQGRVLEPGQHLLVVSAPEYSAHPLPVAPDIEAEFDLSGWGAFEGACVALVRSDFEVPFSDPDYFNELHHDPPEIVDRVAWSTFPYLPSHFLPSWPWVAEGGWGAQEPDSSFPMAMQRRPEWRDTNNNHSDFTLGGLNPQNQGDVNTAPVAADDSYTTARGSFQLTVAAPGVLANDSDAGGHPLTAVEVSGVGHGVLALNANGSFTYTPTPGYAGPDSFTYKANDGELDSNVAMVHVEVRPRPGGPRLDADTHSLALSAGGSLWTWGNNRSDQLGYETYAHDGLTPTRIGTDTDWVAVSAGPSTVWP